MINLSKYYKNKSKTELKIAILKEILECEKILDSQDIRIICDGSTYLHGTDISNKSKSEHLILPEASDTLHRVMLKALGEYKSELENLQEEIEKE